MYEERRRKRELQTTALRNRNKDIWLHWGRRLLLQANEADETHSSGEHTTTATARAVWT
jgi:hypothetical protein